MACTMAGGTQYRGTKEPGYPVTEWTLREIQQAVLPLNSNSLITVTSVVCTLCHQFHNIHQKSP